MFSLFGKCYEKDINSSNLGKVRKYKLARGQSSMLFTGRLLSYYHAEGDVMETAAQNQTYLHAIAIFKTQSRYLIYYVLHYQNNEHISGRVVHVHAMQDMEGVGKFIEAMVYSNKRSFYPAVVDDALAQDG